MKFQTNRHGNRLCSLFCKTNEHAFSRVDLFAVIVLAAFLSFWFGSRHLGERGRIIRCAGNLAMLGKAMQNYANDHNDMLPPAQISLQKASIGWDSKIFAYVKPSSTETGNIRKKREQLFVCPSDPAIHQGAPRSYAMPANDMSPANWPPGPNSATGVGLWWDSNTTSMLLGDDATNHPESLPGVKLSALPLPDDTLALTEFIDNQNVMGGINQTVVWGVVQQQGYFKGRTTDFHHGRFNYLMADGHVELLSPLQTGATDRAAGIWSMRIDY